MSQEKLKERDENHKKINKKSQRLNSEEDNKNIEIQKKKFSGVKISNKNINILFIEKNKFNLQSSIKKRNFSKGRI